MKHFIKPLMFMLLVTVMALAVTSCQAETTTENIAIEQTKVELETDIIADAKAVLISISDIEDQHVKITTTDKEIMRSLQCEFYRLDKTPDEIIDYIQLWVNNNFSSETKLTDALYKGGLGTMGANRPDKIVNVYFDGEIPLRLTFRVISKVVILRVIYLNNTNITTELGIDIIEKFSRNYIQYQLE